MSPAEPHLRVPAPDLHRSTTSPPPERQVADRLGARACPLLLELRRGSSGASRSHRAAGRPTGPRTCAATRSTSGRVSAGAARASSTSAPAARSAPPSWAPTARELLPRGPGGLLHRRRSALPPLRSPGGKRSSPGRAARPGYRGAVARVVVVGAGLGGLAAAARLAARRPRGDACSSRPTPVGGKLGRYARDGHVFDTGPSLVTLPQVYRDLFAATGGPLEDAVDLVRLDPAVAVPVRRRHAADRARHRRRRSRRRWTTPSAPAPARSGRRSWRGPRRCGGSASSRSSAARCRARRRWPGWPAARPTSRRSRRGRRCAASARRHLHRPAPAHAARPLRHLLRLRSAAGARRAGDRAVRRAGVRLLVRARRAAPARRSRWPTRAVDARRRRPHRAARCAGCWSTGGRAAGVELADGERVPADVVVCGADAAALYGRPAARRPADRARVRRSLAPGHAVPVGRRAAARAARPDAGPGAPHRAVPRRLRRGVRRRLRHRPVRPARGPVADPTVYVSAPDDPALRPDDDSESWFVLVNAPRHDPAGGVGLERARARRPVRRPGARRRWPGAGWTSATGCAGGWCGRRPTSSATPAASAARSTARRATAPGRPSCGRPTPPRCRGCSWSAARRTRAAGCRWCAVGRDRRRPRRPRLT